MKIALCIAGITDNYEISYPILKSKLLDKYNPDIYLHGWESDNSRISKIINTYNPIDYLLEGQIDFNKKLMSINLVDVIDKDLAFKRFSYAYSRKKTFELIKDENKYECVIIARYDAYAWHGITLFDESHPQNIIFNHNLDMSYIYVRDWNQKNAGIHDMWIYSNFKNMKIICSLYENLDEYLKIESQYMQWIIGNEGWPYSNQDDEFSCEIDLPKEKMCNNRRKNIKDGILNVHYLYKGHLLINNLYEKVKYL